MAPLSLFIRAAAIAALLSMGAADSLKKGNRHEKNSPDPLPYKVQTPPLDTDWTYTVGTDPWPEHPRPLLHRDQWQSLNGIWIYENADHNDGPQLSPATTMAQLNASSDSANTVGNKNNSYRFVPSQPPQQQRQQGREVMIPSCVESGLSGIQEYPVTRMWFSRRFRVEDDAWQRKRVLLHFEAVDYEATVFLNGVKVGYHIGGFFRFSIDVTDSVKLGGEQNYLQVFVCDPTDLEMVPVGKQTRNPSHIFYRSCSGIWQTVWLESVQDKYITDLDITADMDGKVTFTVHSLSKNNDPVKVNLFDNNGRQVALAVGKANKESNFQLPSAPNLWTPDTPYLYNLTVSMGDDMVSSYTAFRSVSVGQVDGVQRPLLNGKFTFLMATLDQGFWPDGLFVPPNREAMIYDLQMLKNLGFNTVRKHIKVEPDLFYRACDEIGLAVIQDMPSMPADGRMPNPEEQAEFGRQLELLINEHKNYPSIITWVIYNEGWAQLRNPPWPEGPLTDKVRELDPTRLIDSVTGWNDHGFGDFSDNHHYANPQCGSPFSSLPGGPYDPTRIGFQGEFGGVGHNVSAQHLWKVRKSVDEINQTYEMDETLEAYNYRTGVLFGELRDQIEKYACSGAVYTQTTDVEGELNGLLTYDRRILRPNPDQWREDIGNLYEAARRRGGA